LAACAMEGPGGSGAKPAARELSMPVAPACSPPVSQVTIDPGSFSGSSGSIGVNPGTAHVNPRGGGVRWKFNQNTYAFTSDGVTFKSNSPPGPTYAPPSGDTSVYSWCFADTSARDSTWSYTIKFSAPDGKVWSCDPTIVNRGGVAAGDDVSASVPCTRVTN